MPDPFNFLTVQASPCGFRAGPHVAAYSTNGGQDPQNFSNDIPAAFENAADGFAWRAYDRAIRIRNDVDGVEFFAYHGRDVWRLFDGSNWQSAINMLDQTSALGFGVHTGLYHVTQRDGVEHVCGLYQSIGGLTGFVKFDPRANLWTDGTIAGTVAGGNGSASGKCSPFKGKLYHPTANRLQEFDPLTDSIEYEYEPPPGVTFGVYAKTVVCQQRLFLVTDEGAAHLLELAFGTLIDHGTFAPEAQVAKSAGGDVLAYIPGPAELSFFVVYGSASGGIGVRSFSVAVGEGDQEGTAVAFSTIAPPGVGSIPDGVGGCDTFSGFCRDAAYPSGAAGSQNDTLRDGAYQLEQAPAFTPASGNVNGASPLLAVQVPMLKWGFDAIYGDCLALPLLVNGVASIDLGATFFTFRHAAGTNDVTRAFSQNTGQWANTDRLFGRGPSISNVRAEPYRDALVERGLLLTFHVTNSIELGNVGSFFYFGYGRRLERQNRRCHLKVGTNPTRWVGGVAQFGDGAPHTKGVLAQVPRGGFDQVTLSTGTATGFFTLGEIVEGQTSLARGILQIRPADEAAMFLTGLTGAFVDGETVLGLTSGNSAPLNAEPQRIVTYQIVWDVGSSGDNVPEREWVSLQAIQFNGTGDESNNAMVSSADWQIQVLTFDTFFNPVTTQSGVAQQAPDTSATLITTQGATGQMVPDTTATPATTQSAKAQALPNTSQTPITTHGPALPQYLPNTSETPITTQAAAAEAIPDANLEGRLVRPVASRPSVQGGGTVGVFDNDTDQGQRDAITFLDPSAPALPGQTFEGGSTALPEGPEVKLRIDGVVELGRATLDCVNGAIGTRAVLLDVTAAGLHALQPVGTLPAGSVPGVGTLAIKTRLVALTGPISVQPVISVGVGGTFDDHVPATALGLTAQDEIEDMPLLAVRSLLRGGDVLEVELDGQATAGVYQIELILYAFHRVR